MALRYSKVSENARHLCFPVLVREKGRFGVEVESCNVVPNFPITRLTLRRGLTFALKVSLAVLIIPITLIPAPRHPILWADPAVNRLNDLDI